MKILEISNYFPEHTGGIEFVALNLVTRWRKRHSVRWMACNVKDRPHTVEPDDIPLPSLNFAEARLGFPYPIPIGDSFLRIVREVRNADVIHIHDCLYLANIVAFFASRWYNKPLLVTQHVGLVPYLEAYKNILQRAAYASLGKLVLERAEQVIFISERVKAWFETQINFRHPPLFIPNGIDTRLFYPATSEERKIFRENLGILPIETVLLFVGRFTPKKGLHYIYELARARPAWKWLLIGSGEIDPHRWQLPNLHIIPPMSQANLRQYYVAADLLILPSVGEGVPLAIQESLACGLPAAVSSQTASYLPNSPLISLDLTSFSSMLQTLEVFFASGEQIDTWRIASVNFSRQWNWDTVSNQYELILEKLRFS